MDPLDIFRIAFRLQTLFFPADLYELAQIFAQRGYALQGSLGPRRPTPIALTGGILNPMAMKDDMLIDVNTDRGLVGVTGPNPTAIMELMTEIVEIFRDHYHIQKNDYMFFEFSGQIRRNPDADPIATMGKLSTGAGFVEKCNKIFDVDSGIRSVRLGSKGAPLESINYFDLTIEPLLSASQRTMVVQVIHRQADFETLKQKTSNLHAQMEQAIRALQE